MSPVCSHTDSIVLTELPAAIAGREDWSWCYLDQVAFVMTTSDRERG